MLSIWHRTEGLISSTKGFRASVYNTLSILKNHTHMVWWWKSRTEFSETGLELLTYILPGKDKTKQNKSTLKTRNADFLHNVIYYLPISLSCLD